MAYGLPRSFLLILHKHQCRTGVVVHSSCLGCVSGWDPNAAASILGQMQAAVIVPADG